MAAAGEPGQKTLSVSDAVVGVKWDHSRKMYDLLLDKGCSYSTYAEHLGEHTCPHPQGKKGLWRNVGFYLDEDWR